MNSTRDLTNKESSNRFNWSRAQVDIMEAFLCDENITDRHDLRTVDQGPLLKDLGFHKYEGIVTDYDESLMTIITKKVESKLESLLRNRLTALPLLGRKLPLTRAQLAKLAERQDAVILPSSIPNSPSSIVVYNINNPHERFSSALPFKETTASISKDDASPTKNDTSPSNGISPPKDGETTAPFKKVTAPSRETTSSSEERNNHDYAIPHTSSKNTALLLPVRSHEQSLFSQQPAALQQEALDRLVRPYSPPDYQSEKLTPRLSYRPMDSVIPPRPFVTDELLETQHQHYSELDASGHGALRPMASINASGQTPQRHITSTPISPLLSFASSSQGTHGTASSIKELRRQDATLTAMLRNGRGIGNAAGFIPAPEQQQQPFSDPHYHPLQLSTSYPSPPGALYPHIPGSFSAASPSIYGATPKSKHLTPAVPSPLLHSPLPQQQQQHVAYTHPLSIHDEERDTVDVVDSPARLHTELRNVHVALIVSHEQFYVETQQLVARSDEGVRAVQHAMEGLRVVAEGMEAQREAARRHLKELRISGSVRWV